MGGDCWGRGGGVAAPWGRGRGRSGGRGFSGHKPPPQVHTERETAKAARVTAALEAPREAEPPGPLRPSARRVASGQSPRSPDDARRRCPPLSRCRSGWTWGRSGRRGRLGSGARRAFGQRRGVSSPAGRADLTRTAVRPPRVPSDAAVVRAGWSVCEAAVWSVVLDSLISVL